VRSTDTLLALHADAITRHHNPEDHSIQVLASLLVLAFTLPDATVSSQLRLSLCLYCLHPVAADEVILNRGIGYVSEQSVSVIHRYNNYNNINRWTSKHLVLSIRISPKQRKDENTIDK
jgi:hypothetical protein